MRIVTAIAGILLVLSSGLYGHAAGGADAATNGSSRSAGCANSMPAAGRLSLTAPDGNKRSRTYVVQLPTAYDPARAYPLVFVFHAANGNAAQAMSWGLQSVPDAAGSALFVFPNGIAYQNFGVGWDDTRSGYDLPFFDKMLDSLAGSYCIDRSRIFATGFSWGADFVTTLICLRGGVLRGAQVNSASDEYKVANDAATYQNQPCSSQAMPAIRFQHADGGDPQYPPPLFATTSNLFRQLSRCTGGPSPRITPGITPAACERQSACVTPYSECVFPAALGHVLPPHWAIDTWAFFSGL